MITLALDASTYAGSVAVLRDGDVVAEQNVAMKDAQHDHLMPAVAAALASAGVGVRDLDRVVCGAGPGSFTSLRIAGAIAKGIATGAGKPLFAVSSMGLMVGGGVLPVGSYLTALDALRGEFYVGLYDVTTSGGVVERERARLVPEASVDAVAAEYGARVVSATLRASAIEAPPRARGVLRLGSDSIIQVDLDSWEPAYGRLAEAQVRWEQAHGRPLSAE